MGVTVTITGTGFNTTPANNIVFFGATRATVTAATATSLTVTVPTGATFGAITELNTGTSLAAYSTQFFNPTFSPNKSSITTADISTKVDFTTGTNPVSVAIGDLDGDGKPDLAVANQNSATVSVLRNTSTSGSIVAGSFAAKVDFATGSSPYSVAIGDLDGDGKPDLAVANQNSATVSVFRNTSTSGSIAAGSFAAIVNFTTGTNPFSVAIGDLDGDGKPDLAVANQNSTTVSVFRNTSTSGSIAAGSFAAKVDFATGTTPYSVAIGDLDGDGKPDLAVANYSSTTVSVLRNADIVVLPVTLLSYEAKLTSTGTIQLNWLTATETNNSLFEVLRSADGINFTAIGKVTAVGNTTQEKRYNFTDLSPLAGNNYYQLVQYDKDGKKKVLGIRLVKVSQKKGTLTIYPNPSNGVFNLSFEANSYHKVELIDLAGKILMTRAIGRQERTMSFNISNLAAGIYNVKLTGNEKVARKQIVKE